MVKLGVIMLLLVVVYQIQVATNGSGLIAIRIREVPEESDTGPKNSIFDALLEFIPGRRLFTLKILASLFFIIILRVNLIFLAIFFNDELDESEESDDSDEFFELE